VSLRIADADEAGVGEVLVRSRAAMRGYWKQPSSDVIDGAGWVHTGDLGRLDGLGNLVLVGRVVEMYTRGGYNVYPAEVEAVLGAHPAVAQVAVVGVADPVLGSVGVACVVAGDAVGAAELRAWCQGQLADYKAPDRVVFMDHLPLTSMAKVDKRALARQVEGDR
jgi:acyl-CoA synthetase (AMP-forming)/AMP-acid ligase II